MECVLADAKIGLGKTIQIVAVLNAHFFDGSPKILFFPNHATVENLYRERLWAEAAAFEQPLLQAFGPASAAAGSDSVRLETRWTIKINYDDDDAAQVARG